MPSEARPGLNGGDELGDIGHLLELLHRRPDWMADALCQEHPEVTWFPATGESPVPAQTICSRCLVVDECRAWALGQGLELHGVWGGLSERDRCRGVTTPRPAPAAVKAPREAAPWRDNEDDPRPLAAHYYPEAVALLARLG